MVGAGGARHDAGRAGHARARTRCSRPRCSWWSASSTTPPAPATSAGSRGSASASRPLLVIAVGATASMAALPPFLGFVAKEADFETLSHSASLGRRGAVRAGGRRVRLGVHHDLQPALRVGRVRAQGPSATQPTRRRDAPAAQRPSWSRPAILAVGGLAVRALARTGWTRARRLRRHRARRPALPPRTLARAESAAAAVDSGARGRHRGLLRPRTGCGGSASATCRWATPTASTTPSSAALDVLSVRLTALTQRGSIPATQAVILSTLVLLPAGGAGARCARPAASSGCGIRRCRWWSG